MPYPVSSDLTVCLREFAKFGGKTFSHESPRDLTLKFVIYILFPNDWEHIYLCTFAKDKRIEKQVQSLRLVLRSRVPRLDAVQCFRLLRSIKYKHHVHKDTHELIVRGHGRRHRAHHYHRFAEKMQSVSTNLTPHRDTLFLLRLAQPEQAEDILLELPVASELGVSHEDIDSVVLPRLKDGANEDREAQLTELAHILSFADMDESCINVSSLQRTGTLPSYRSEDDENFAIRKSIHRDRVVAALKTRENLLLTTDPAKLQSLEVSVRQHLNWMPNGAVDKLAKKDLIQAHSNLNKICAVLGEVQREGISKHRHDITMAEDLMRKREALIEKADQETMYERGLSEALEWRPKSLASIAPAELRQMVERLNSHIGHLEQHQIVEVQ